jgi:hypothetical protein
LGLYGLDMDGWYSLGINDYFCMLFGFVNLPELVKYLRVERYLAAKIGTISLGLLWWVVFISMVDVVLFFCWVLLLLISAFIR